LNTEEYLLYPVPGKNAPGGDDRAGGEFTETFKPYTVSGLLATST
jgi:hypothetical protein